MQQGDGLFNHPAVDSKAGAVGLAAAGDVRAQAGNDVPEAPDLAKRYPKAQARDYDGNPGRITEADALIAYLQTLGTLVDFKLYDDKANIR